MFRTGDAVLVEYGRMEIGIADQETVFINLNQELFY